MNFNALFFSGFLIMRYFIVLIRVVMQFLFVLAKQ